MIKPKVENVILIKYAAAIVTGEPVWVVEESKELEGVVVYAYVDNASIPWQVGNDVVGLPVPQHLF